MCRESVWENETAFRKLTEEMAPRVGVWIGSGIGGMETHEQQFLTFQERGVRRVSPFFVPMMIQIWLLVKYPFI